MGLSKIKEAQGVWLSPAWLSLRGDLSAQAPGSGQEFDLRDSAFHSWMPPGVGGARGSLGGGCLVVEENGGGTEGAEVWSSRAAQPHCCSVSASLPAPAPPRSVFFL